MTTENKNVLQIMAEGIANANQNVVAVYEEVQILKKEIEKISNALFPSGESNTGDLKQKGEQNGEL